MKKSPLNTIITVAVSLLSFLVPLFFLPFTFEFFEFNKLVLISVFTLILFVLYAVKGLVEGRLIIAKSPINLGFLALILVIIASTIFSQNWIGSLIGTHGRYAPSLLITLILFLLMNLVASISTDSGAFKNILRSLHAGLLLSAIIGFIRYLAGSNLASTLPDFIKYRTFSTLGSPTMLTTVSAVVVSLTLAKAFAKRETSKANVIFWISFVLSIVALANVAFISTLAGWATLLIGFVTVLIMNRKAISGKGLLAFAILGIVTVFFGVISFVPSIRKSFNLPTDYQREVSLSVKESWIIASSSVRDFPIFGSGLSTFDIDFSRYKSLGFNATPFWSVSFDRPFNEFFQIIATLGIAGALVVTFLASKVYKEIKVSANNNPEAVILVVVTAGSLLFSYGASVSLFILIVALGLLIAGNNPEKAKSSELIPSSAPLIALAFSAIFLLTGLYATTRIYGAEVYYRKAVVSGAKNDALETYTNIRKSVAWFPFFDAYRRDYARVNLTLANLIATKKDLNDNDKSNIQQLLSQSLRESLFVSETLGPNVVANWELRASVYRNLLGTAQNADTWAESSYQKVIGLDPLNPMPRLNLGGLYFSAENYNAAIGSFSTAVNLKRDFANAHYNLAYALAAAGDKVNAKSEFEVAKSLVAVDSADYKAVEEQIQALGETGEEEEKPTVESIQGEEPVPQAPLSEPTEEATTSASGQ